MADVCDICESSAAGTDTLPSAVLRPLPLENTGALTDAALQGLYTLVLDSAASSTALLDLRVELLTSSGTITAQAIQTGTVWQFIDERAQALDRLLSVMNDLAVSSGTLSAIAFQNAMADLVRDAGAFHDVVLPGLTVTDLAVARYFVSDQAWDTMIELALSSGQFSDEVINLLASGDMAASSGLLAEAVTASLHAVEVLADESGTLTEATFDQLTALELVKDEGFVGSMVPNVGSVGWWTAPTDSFAMSRYTLPQFNSMAVAGDTLLLLGADGAFVRGGTDDVGVSIAAHLTTGLDNYTSEHLLRLGYLYLRYTSTETVGVDVGETSTGQEVTYNYTMPARPADVATHGRIALGHGLRSSHYRFTLRNTNGSALRITDAKVDVIDTSRKS